MSPPVPRTAMVFAAGLGARMRPITDALPKPLVKVGGQALIDHCLDRLAENGVERAIVNVHWLADQVEAHLAERRAENHFLRRAREASGPGRRHQARASVIGGEPFLICNTDAFWIEGPRSNLARLAEAFDPTGWTSCSWSRRAPERSGSTGRAISPWAAMAARAARVTPCRAFRLYRRRDHQA